MNEDDDKETRSATYVNTMFRDDGDREPRSATQVILGIFDN